MPLQNETIPLKGSAAVLRSGRNGGNGIAIRSHRPQIGGSLVECEARHGRDQLFGGTDMIVPNSLTGSHSVQPIFQRMNIEQYYQY